MKNSLFVVGLIGVIGLSTQAHGLGRIPKKQHLATVAELEKAKAELEEARRQQEEAAALARAKIEGLEGANAQLLKDMDSSKSALQQRVAEFTREKQELEKQKSEEVDKLKSTYDSLVQDMKKEIDQGSIQITQLQDKLSVSMVDKIVFDSGEAELNEQGKQVLKRVANVLKKVKGKQIRIEGHTDNIPIGGALKDKFPSNWELSTARATTVARFLQEMGGIDPKVLYSAGYAENRPIADNSTPEGRAKNRRIEVALVPIETASATPPAKTETPAEKPKAQ